MENSMQKLSDQFDKDQLIKEFKAVVADAEALLNATANTGDDKFSELRVKAEESLLIAKARIMDIQTNVVAKARAAANATDDYVHENPWRSIGFAASLGVVVGLLIGRR
jgi:ElaB/YqjD/DUF883 family membrane-anchored ribosome-binding protein